MNWINTGKSSWTYFAGITFAIIVLFSTSSRDVPAPTNTLAPADTPAPAFTIASAPTETPIITSSPTAADIPTRSYPTPILVSPAYGATIVGEKLTNFSWQWGGTLQKGEKFDLRIWRPEKPCSSVSIRRNCTYLLDTPPDGFGGYQWQVAVVRIDESGSKSTLCESSIWPFVWSQSDAVVNTEALNLRSGPGLVYDIVGGLKRGDPLKVTGKNPAGNWLMVTCPGGQEGWVAAWLLQIKRPLAEVTPVPIPPMPTPMYTPTPTATPTLLPPPILLEPENGASFIGPVLLKWQWDYRPRAPDEIFSLWVFKEGEEVPCHHYQPRDLEYRGDLTYCSEGKHYWGVALIRELCTDCPEEERWQNLSNPSVRRWFHYTPADEPWEWPTPSGDDDDGGGTGGLPAPP